MAFRAVLFDWRGTLVVSPTPEAWAGEALRRLGRPVDAARDLAVRLGRVEEELDGPGVDADPTLHRDTYLRVLRGLGLDDELVTSLYDVESDPAVNVFADDAATTMHRLKDAGLRLAVVSDIHLDIRPAFDAAGLAGTIDVFTLSVEQGMQKPDPAMFTRTLSALAVAADEALMVGDRSRPDGAAVEVGIATLLLPPLTDPAERRQHHVLALCGAADGRISHAR